METRLNSLVSAELLSAAKCNLDCTYCYIPKGSEYLDTLHKNIIKEVQEVDPLIEKLKSVFGNRLEYLAHWGTEPSLTARYYKDFYKKAIHEFPDLKVIAFSSNFLSRSKINELADLILTLPQSKKLNINIQMSLDGPAWITDENRRGGSTEIIINNIYRFIELINEHSIPHKIRLHFKPTLSKAQYMRLLDSGETNIQYYYQLFEEVLDEMHERNKIKAANILSICDPTLVCPDHYSKNDGILFNKIYEESRKLAYEKRFKYFEPGANYFNFFCRVFNSTEFFSKSRMFTCSAGDSQMGIGEYYHMCHDTFYLPYSEINDSVYESNDRTTSREEIDNLESGRTQFIVDHYTLHSSEISESSSQKFDQFKYKMRGYHDFTKLKLSYTMAMIKEMVQCSQLSECYRHNEIAQVLAMYVMARHNCPTRQLMYTSSSHILLPELLKIFGNGLVENFIKRFISTKG